MLSHAQDATLYFCRYGPSSVPAKQTLTHFILKKEMLPALLSYHLGPVQPSTEEGNRM